MFVINKRTFFLKVALISVLLSMICRMLTLITDNNSFRLFGYGFQFLNFAGCSAQWLLLTKKKVVTRISSILLILIVYESAVTLMTDSFMFPHTLIDIFVWPFNVVVFCDFAYQYDIEQVIKRNIFVVYCIICVLCIPLIITHLAGEGNAGQAIFLTYYCITLLPIIFLAVDNSKQQKICMILAVTISLASTKRAGTIALVTGLFVMALIKAHIQGSLKKKYRKYVQLFLLMMFGFAVLVYLDSYSSLQIFSRFRKLSTDGGSGRDIIWELVLNAYRTSSSIKSFFGHGFQSVYYVLKPGGFYRFAHNSYIEYLYDYGIAGLGLLLLFLILLIGTEIKMIRKKSEYAPVLGLLLVITVVLSVFSYFFEESNIIMPISVACGTILGLEKKRIRILYGQNS